MAHNLFHLLAEGLAVPRSVVLALGRTSSRARGGEHVHDRGMQYLTLGAGIVATVYAVWRIVRELTAAKLAGADSALMLIALLVVVKSTCSRGPWPTGPEAARGGGAGSRSGPRPASSAYALSRAGASGASFGAAPFGVCWRV